MALVALAGAANAQVPAVEFRIVERQSQVTIPNPPVAGQALNDNQLNYAVQGRVTGATGNAGIGNFSFDIVASGEPDASGSLFFLATSMSNGTYDPNTTQSTSSSNGPTGMAAQYRYLVGINPNFGGLVNTSGGTFTNTAANQEIGLVTGSNTGAALLQQTDFTGGGPFGTDPDGNPDTYSGSGTTAPLDQTYANTYLGANGNFVDLFRFKYLVTNTTTTRNIVFTLANATAQLTTGFQLSSGIWGPVTGTPGSVTVTPASAVHVVGVPAPASVALLGLGGLVATRRRRVTA